MEGKIVDISPKYGELLPSGYYVYVHAESDTGRAFYVGKGNDRRGWTPEGRRSKKWTNIARKHGCVIEIAQDNLSEDDAHLLEMWLIAKLRHEGYRLANHTDGGEGVTGLVFSDESKAKISKTRKKRRVYCSNGMMFETVRAAGVWLRDILSDSKVSHAGISSCCNGRLKSYKGFAWSDLGVPDPPKFSGVEAIRRGKSNSRKRVYSSCGMEFEGMVEAIIWLKDNGYPKATDSRIYSVCTGNSDVAYDRQWSYTPIESKEVCRSNERKGMANHVKRKPVARSDGLVFDSARIAASWIRYHDGLITTRDMIRRLCNNGLPDKNGYTWKWRE